VRGTAVGCRHPAVDFEDRSQMIKLLATGIYSQFLAAMLLGKVAVSGRSLAQAIRLNGRFMPCARPGAAAPLADSWPPICSG